MRQRARLKRLRPKPAPAAEWDLVVTALMGGAGLLAGFIAEIIWKGNMLWMTAGGMLGGFAGCICDTALFLYRRRCRRSHTER